MNCQISIRRCNLWQWKYNFHLGSVLDSFVRGWTPDYIQTPPWNGSSKLVHGYPIRSPYVASKWVVIGLTKTMAMELGKFSIRVNTVCPNAVERPRMHAVIAAEAKVKGLPIRQASSLSTWSWHKNTLLTYSKQLSGKSFSEKRRCRSNGYRLTCLWFGGMDTQYLEAPSCGWNGRFTYVSAKQQRGQIKNTIPV